MRLNKPRFWQPAFFSGGLSFSLGQTVVERPEWSILLYLFLATLPCDILSGFLVFCDRVVYPVYFSVTAAARFFRSRGSAVRRCVDVDLRHRRLSDRRNSFRGAVTRRRKLAPIPGCEIGLELSTVPQTIQQSMEVV